MLFDGDDFLFKKLTTSATVYGEYGVGKSTRSAVTHSGCKVLAAETSAEDFDSITRELGEAPRLDARYVDVGPVGEWGPLPTRSATTSCVCRLSRDRDEDPDLVLVDGRAGAPASVRASTE